MAQGDWLTKALMVSLLVLTWLFIAAIVIRLLTP